MDLPFVSWKRIYLPGIFHSTLKKETYLKVFYQRVQLEQRKELERFESQRVSTIII